MYKLVACDVDGTLLRPGENAICPDLFVCINNLYNMGVEFVVASGRPYYELVRLFAPVAAQITFICCDGAVVVRNGRVLFELPMDCGAVCQLAGTDREYRLYGLRDAYDDVDSVHGNIYKVCIKNVARDICLPESVCIGYDDCGMTEFLSLGADKGVALTFLQKKFRISSDECIAFGDNRNDFWMLRSVKTAYAMKNAKSDLSGATQNVTNDVLQTLNELFFNKRNSL